MHDGLSFHGEHKSPARMTQESKANKKKFWLVLITLEQCKTILRNNDCRLSDEEIKQVREFLYLMASFQYEVDNNEINREVI